MREEKMCSLVLLVSRAKRVPCSGGWGSVAVRYETPRREPEGGGVSREVEERPSRSPSTRLLSLSVQESRRREVDSPELNLVPQNQLLEPNRSRGVRGAGSVTGVPN